MEEWREKLAVIALIAFSGTLAVVPVSVLGLAISMAVSPDIREHASAAVKKWEKVHGPAPPSTELLAGPPLTMMPPPPVFIAR